MRRDDSTPPPDAEPARTVSSSRRPVGPLPGWPHVPHRVGVAITRWRPPGAAPSPPADRRPAPAPRRARRAPAHPGRAGAAPPTSTGIRARSAPSAIFTAAAAPAGQRRRVHPLRAVLGQHAGRAGHQPGHVPAGAADQLGVGAHRVRDPPLRRARLGGDQPGEGPGQPGQRQPEQRRTAAVDADRRDRLAGEVLDRRRAARPAAGGRAPGTRPPASRSPRRSAASPVCLPEQFMKARAGPPPAASTARAASSPSGSAGGQRRALSGSELRLSRSRTRRTCAVSPEWSWPRPRRSGGRPGRARRAACRPAAAACWPSAGRCGSVRLADLEHHRAVRVERDHRAAVHALDEAGPHAPRPAPPPDPPAARRRPGGHVARTGRRSGCRAARGRRPPRPAAAARAGRARPPAPPAGRCPDRLALARTSACPPCRPAGARRRTATRA